MYRLQTQIQHLDHQPPRKATQALSTDYYGVPCSKAGESLLQGDCVGFDFLALHQPGLGHWLSASFGNWIKGVRFTYLGPIFNYIFPDDETGIMHGCYPCLLGSYPSLGATWSRSATVAHPAHYRRGVCSNQTGTLWRYSLMAKQTAHIRKSAGSVPATATNYREREAYLLEINSVWRHLLTARKADFQSVNAGSIPAGATN